MKKEFAGLRKTAVSGFFSKPLASPFLLGGGRKKAKPPAIQWTRAAWLRLKGLR
jgi:hypothetical protein